MESPENDTTVFRPSHSPWRSKTISTLPPPRQRTEQFFHLRTTKNCPNYRDQLRLLAVMISVGIARVYRIQSTIMLVLGGIISGALFSSLLSLVKYLSDPYNQLPTIVNWLMGSLTLSDRATILRTSIPILIGLVIMLAFSRHLNVMSMGDEEAHALGVNVRRVRLIVIVCATVVSAMTVVIAGTIAWVGLIVPHFTRLITGPDNTKLLPATILIGAAYLIVVDDIARMAFTFELPIGVVTALVGIPCFAFVLRNARKGWN